MGVRRATGEPQGVRIGNGNNTIDRSRQTPAVRSSARRLDVLLELLERRDMSPTKLRILLAVGQGETGLGELSRRLDQPEATVRRSAWQLSQNGMLRQQPDPATKKPAFSITTRGVAALKPLITASNRRSSL
jgi:DNA-binding MarR family transcriptional regulator